MVNAKSLKPGDKVRLPRVLPGEQRYIHESSTASGKREHINDDYVFTVADPVSYSKAPYYVRVESPLGKNGVFECTADLLDYVSTDDAVANLHDMRSAGPPAPASCSCDIMSLMRAGCRCGYLAKEREASS